VSGRNRPVAARGRERPLPGAAVSTVLGGRGGRLFLLRQERRGQSVEIAHRIVWARMPALEKFVEHPPLAEQPMALHALERVLVDPEGSHLERAIGTVVRHLDPQRACPGAVGFDADQAWSSTWRSVAGFPSLSLYNLPIPSLKATTAFLISARPFEVLRENSSTPSSVKVST
jgi:hypothetical protein